MIVKLRKRHFYTWAILAIAIPVMVVLAYGSVRTNATQSLVTKPDVAFSNVVANSQGQYLLLNLREQQGQYQVEVTVLKPIQAANTMLQIQSGDKNLSLGRLESTGLYRFKIPENVVLKGQIQFRVFDEIKKTEIEKINISI